MPVVLFSVLYKEELYLRVANLSPYREISRLQLSASLRLLCVKQDEIMDMVGLTLDLEFGLIHLVESYDVKASFGNPSDALYHWARHEPRVH